MDFNKIKSFVYVAKLGSVTKAAENLYLTQQAVSQQIQALEEETGLQLLKRTNNRIYLTKEGEQLYQVAYPRLNAILETVIKLNGDMTSLDSTITLGAASEYTYKMLPVAIMEFKKQYPNIKFKIYTAPDYELEDMIFNHTVDIGILVNYKNQTLLETIPFYSEEFILVCSPDFFKQYSPIDSYARLLEIPFVDYTESLGGFGRWVKINCKDKLKLFMSRKPDIIAEDDNIIRKLIRSGVAMGFAPKSLVMDDLKQNKLVELFPESSPVVVNIDIVQLKKRTVNLSNEKFVSYLCEKKKFNFF